jgi:hypothetical protein
MSKWVSGLCRFRSIAFAGCVALIFSSVVARAQTFKITNLTSNSASKASFPTMVVDGSGTLNVAWIDNAKGIQFARSTSAAGGTALGAVVTIPGSSGQALPAFQPQIAVRTVSGPTPNIEIVWAALDPASPASAPTYDVFASRANLPGPFVTTPLAISTTPTTPNGVPLADSPRVAFDTTGAVDVVWGQNNVWISQSIDGTQFPSPPMSLMPENTPLDTGGPRIAVDAAGNIFVAWTDESGKNGAGSYCTGEVMANGTVTNASGGNFWINETLPESVGTPVNLSATNTRNLSKTDWVGVNSKFPLGFYGCSYDNLNLFLDGIGRLHLLWSDDSPFQDVLTSENHGNRADGFTLFSFPINLATHSAASPNVAVDKNGSFYVTWSGSPDPGAPKDSEGIFFSRSDDAGSTFTTEVNVAPSGSISPAFPQIAVDPNGNVNVAWEQPTAALKGDGGDMFNVFFARSTDKGNTFPTVLQVSTNPSVLCFKPTNPIQMTPDKTTCGSVQIGVDTSSTPDMVWVSQASGSAIADIDFATATFPTGSISPNAATLSASNALANFTVTVSQSGFPGPITFSCVNGDTGKALPSWLSCSFSPQTLNPSQSNTDTLTISRVGTPTAGLFISGPSSRNLPGFARPVAWNAILAMLWLIAALVMVALGRRRALSSTFLARGLLLMTLTIALTVGLVSCGGSTSSPSSSTTTTTTTSGGGAGGGGGTGGGNSVTMHVAVLAQSGGSTTNLGTVTITAQ